MIIVRSPLRISLAGGGTDLKQYYQQSSDKSYGAVCSLSINKYVYVTVNNLTAFFPHRFRISYSQTELVQESKQIKHPIVRESLRELEIHGGIDINVMADIPAGTGMGSSSSFTVSLLHALHAFNHKLIAKEELARLACKLEIDLLREPIGKQDQYAAAFGGINYFKFNSNESVCVEPLPISEKRKQDLVSHLMLFYLGGNRQASGILKEQSDNTVQNREFLDRLRDQATEVAQILSEERPLSDLGEILLEGWNLKKKLANGISSPLIDDVMKKALTAGAIGGKLLGAGGTGFLLLFVPPEKQEKTRLALKGFSEVSFDIDDLGTTLLYYSS